MKFNPSLHWFAKTFIPLPLVTIKFGNIFISSDCYTCILIIRPISLAYLRALRSDRHHMPYIVVVVKRH